MEEEEKAKKLKDQKHEFKHLAHAVKHLAKV